MISAPLNMDTSWHSPAPILTRAEFDEAAEALEGVRHITEEVVPAINGVDGLIAGYWGG